ncbi:MAG: hypothetical protein KDC53_20505 [Saprospiraceae bacterium]|nr:hypothetical protein [Saprospiraceae bacterium]
MSREFKSHAEAIQWIARNAETESHFEILKDELEFNHTYTGEYFINLLLLDNDVAFYSEAA